MRKDLAVKIDLIGPSVIGEVILGDGEGKLEIVGTARFSTAVEGRPIMDLALVCERLAADLIIGAATMQAHNIRLDLKNEKIEVGPHPKIELI